ncbi:MAG: hypothetical protein R6V10_06485 [bacterium]
MSGENLWGTIPRLKDIETPGKILREQSDYLSQATEGVLEAHVLETWKGTSDDGVGEDKHNDDLKELHLDLCIRSPFLEGHFINVIRVIHQLQIFPVTMVNFLTYPFEYITINNAEEFKQHLSRVLQSEELLTELKEMIIKAKLVE